MHAGSNDFSSVKKQFENRIVYIIKTPSHQVPSVDGHLASPGGPITGTPGVHTRDVSCLEKSSLAKTNHPVPGALAYKQACVYQL